MDYRLTIRAVYAHARRAAALTYWRLRLGLIRRKIVEVETEVISLHRASQNAIALAMIELQRKQEGRIAERDACRRIKSLGGTLRRDPTQNTPARRHHEQRA